MLILYSIILGFMIIIIIWFLKLLYNIDYFYQLENGCMISKS